MLDFVILLLLIGFHFLIWFLCLSEAKTLDFQHHIIMSFSFLCSVS